ncbi:MAG: hypothetical protein IJA36_09865 [Lachnospiraceae bacterium]|nr:hypothetical protein [Lachnospiraceae bacterium]
MKRIKEIVTLALVISILCGNATCVQASDNEKNMNTASTTLTTSTLGPYEFGSTWTTY